MMKHLVLPHPRLESRNFILHPMCEIAPDFVHPQLEKDMSHLLDLCVDKSPVLTNSLCPNGLRIFSEDQLLFLRAISAWEKPHWPRKLPEILKLQACWKILVRIHIRKNFTLNLIVLLYP